MTIGSRLHDNDEITEHTEYILPETALKSLGIFLGLTAINDTTHFFSFGKLLNEQMDTALQLSRIYIFLLVCLFPPRITAIISTDTDTSARVSKL